MAKDFDKELEVMKMYTANASLYIKLSTAALALTVTFPKEILKIDKPVVDSRIVFIWVGFLVAIDAGALENLLPDGAGFLFWNWLADRCGLVYGAMLLTFYASASLFTWNAIHSISR